MFINLEQRKSQIDYSFNLVDMNAHDKRLACRQTI